VTLLAYRYALDPTPGQERDLRSHAGGARVAFNWGLARVLAVMDQRAAEATYGLSGDDLTPSLSWSLYSLRKEWHAAKDDVAPWWRECSKEAFNTGLDQLARAPEELGRLPGREAQGPPGRVPRFRSKRKARASVRFTTGAIRCETTHAVLPRLGRIRLHERADLADARVLSATVRFERGRWHVAFTVEQDITRPAPTRPDVTVGVDLGIKTLAVTATSDGEVREVPNPRHLGKALRKVRRLSRAVSRRRGPDRRTRQRPSNRWRRADAARNRALGKVADQRRDAIHKLTTDLAGTYGTVVVEDLHVAGMVRNRRLARHVADASFA
jgi:putative transposase